MLRPQGFVHRLGSIGDRENDSEVERLRHRLLVYMGVMMSGGGVMWGSLAAYYGLVLASVIPFGYIVATVLNLTYFRFTKNFAVARFFQVLMSLVLPFAFQASLGGFSQSGAVMLWAMLALVGALTFSGSRATVKWLVVYAMLTIGCGLLDATVRARFGINASAGVQTFFFVANIVVISVSVFGLTIYLLSQREEAVAALALANEEITTLNERLEDEVATRTQELQSELARSRAILDNMADGLVAIGVDGTIKLTNPAFARLMQIRGSVAGSSAREILPVELWQLAEQSIESKGTAKRAFSLPGNRFGAAVASPIAEGEGDGARRVGSVVLVRDVTLEKEVDRMKTDFIATVSHELRTPLTSVIGFAKLTRKKLVKDIFPHVPTSDRKASRAAEQARGNVDIIVSEGLRLTALINDLLDISKMEAGHVEWKQEPAEPAALIERSLEATSGLFDSEVVEIRREVEADLPQLVGDFDRLLQVLINLISNAAKFTAEGSVTVGARSVPSGVEFSVKDTGSGIEPAHHNLIFDKFKQVGDTLTDKPKGTGLGLPICQQIVDAHGGSIGVDSQVGEGATFSFVIPLIRADSGPLMPGVDALVRRIGRHVDQALPDAAGNILVVDDDANLRELLRQQLTERGYQVQQAVDGSQAIQCVRSNRPDLIILDVMMPDISGFDVAAVLKADPKTQTIPIIILSIVEDSERGYRLGVDQYLQKPAEADVLIEEIQRLLRQSLSPRRVLFVDTEGPASSDIVRLLEAKGFQLVGSCTGEACLEEARRTRPDLIIVEASYEGSENLIQSIRFEKDLAHVYVVQLMDKPAETTEERS